MRAHLHKHMDMRLKEFHKQKLTRKEIAEKFWVNEDFVLVD